jgi:hypothetical protein
MMRKKIIFFIAFLLIVTMLLTLSLSSCTKNTVNSKPTVTTEQLKESKASETTSMQTTAAETTSTASTTASETSATQTSESAPLATIGSGAGYNPVINPADFTTKIDNKYFPLVPGTTFIYEGISEKGNEHNEVAVEDETKTILGVTCVVVEDTVKVGGQIIEQTLDWYAQDKNGNVWYFGEDSKEYKNGKVVSIGGSWEAGVKGAKPGIIMEANPKVGDSYRQEYLKSEAEDMADILSLSESASVKYGSFTDCLKTRDYTPLEPNVVENKYYAPGVGEVLITLEKGGTERIELIEIKTEAKD